MDAVSAAWVSIPGQFLCGPSTWRPSASSTPKDSEVDLEEDLEADLAGKRAKASTVEPQPLGRFCRSRCCLLNVPLVTSASLCLSAGVVSKCYTLIIANVSPVIDLKN